MAYSFVAVDFLPPPILSARLRALASSLAVGAASPLRGAAYPLAAAAAAMRLFAQATHAGKVVALAPPPPLSSSSPSPSRRASVLITGGAGGLGLLIARWLASGGHARRVALLSRGGRFAASEAAEVLRSLLAGMSGDVEVTVAAADVGRASDAAEAWRELGEVDAVLHAAGVLQVGPPACAIFLGAGASCFLARFALLRKGLGGRGARWAPCCTPPTCCRWVRSQRRRLTYCGELVRGKALVAAHQDAPKSP